MATNILHMKQIVTSGGMNVIFLAVLFYSKYRIEQILSIIC